MQRRAARRSRTTGSNAGGRKFIASTLTQSPILTRKERGQIVFACRMRAADRSHTVPLSGLIRPCGTKAIRSCGLSPRGNDARSESRPNGRDALGSSRTAEFLILGLTGHFCTVFMAQ